MKYHTLIFDLDGTLADSQEGVLAALNSGLAELGRPLVTAEQGRTFMGPPLEDTIHSLGLYGEDFQTVWDAYARFYRACGPQLTKAVPGMPEACRTLHSAGCRLALASCKDWEYCGPILDLCGFGPSFEAVSGSHHNGVPENKIAVIREALRLLGVLSPEAEAAAAPALDGILMVGDRASDVLGASACGLPCLGVEFCGYAEPGELSDAGAIAVVSTPEEMVQFILNS